MPGMEELRKRLAGNTRLYSPQSLEKDPNDDNRLGPIPRVPVGTMFRSRKELAQSGVHRANPAGIAGSMKGATSVVLSGKYEDDVDQGDVVWYTGAGGRQDDGKKGWNMDGPQVKDQSFEHPHNLKLRITYETGRSIRLVRAINKGYRYDGMYRVTEAYLGKGKSGHAICRFKFEREPDQPPLGPLPATARTTSSSREAGISRRV
ncbi:uncharacterized protein STEHIDRAFT_149411 [Stereum hirsutum FP-91666 SS1]|uniref:uncharacterized protein n=1 Tax=Stereum hirsutum (strain FP-91666) TaxID=721885 RepID=UPI000444A831|nr:uncharacterized protein STEHIDRAFT_149411 [Stereum hirsutum FP-91666 SS1]EIM82230.1 hypothetical protein STEHIDRAFT_149411 [Stereum hirsutum FP-91666 SS1]